MPRHPCINNAIAPIAISSNSWQIIRFVTWPIETLPAPTSNIWTPISILHPACPIPQVVDLHHPFPHLANKALYIAVTLQRAQMHTFGLVPIPLPFHAFFFCQGGGVHISCWRTFWSNTSIYSSMYNVTDRTILSVTRNADINPNDFLWPVIFDEDYHHMKNPQNAVALRRCGWKSGQYFEPLLAFLTARLSLPRQQVFYSKTPLDLSFVGSLAEHCPLAVLRQLSLSALCPAAGRFSSPNRAFYRWLHIAMFFLPFLSKHATVFAALHEASQDPAVLSIRITHHLCPTKPNLSNISVPPRKTARTLPC